MGEFQLNQQICDTKCHLMNSNCDAYNNFHIYHKMSNKFMLKNKRNAYAYIYINNKIIIK